MLTKDDCSGCRENLFEVCSTIPKELNPAVLRMPYQLITVGDVVRAECNLCQRVAGGCQALLTGRAYAATITQAIKNLEAEISLT